MLRTHVTAFVSIVTFSPSMAANLRPLHPIRRCLVLLALIVLSEAFTMACVRHQGFSTRFATRIHSTLTAEKLYDSISFENFEAKLKVQLSEGGDEVDNASSIVLLLDPAIRNPIQVTEALATIPSTKDGNSSPRLLSNWNAFSAKMQESQQDLLGDKFMYQYDVGKSSVDYMSVARIPATTSEKLDLAKRLIAKHDGKRGKPCILMSLTEFGVTVDRDMTTAFYSALQLHLNTMPSFKRSPSEVDNVKHASIQSEMIIVLPKGGDFDDTLAASECTVSERIDREEDYKTSLARTMEQASRSRYGPTDSLEDNNSYGGDLSRPQLNETLRRCSRVNYGTHLCRYLAALPPNELSPKEFTALVEHFAKNRGWELTAFTPNQLKEIGCGAFSAVIQANQQDTDGESNDRLVRLSFRKSVLSPTAGVLGSIPHLAFAREGASVSRSSTSARPIVLVGKGVCYDTGGLSIKSAKSMKTMKHDMAGASAALGTFACLDLLEEPIDAECWLALAENNVGNRAYRPDDVVRTVSGQTIEIVDTDAEGRLLLADTLALASRRVPFPSQKLGVKCSGIDFSAEKTNVAKMDRQSSLSAVGATDTPAIVLDFATLTGSCVTALTSRFMGAITNRPEYLTHIAEAGQYSGDLAWPFPPWSTLNELFADDLKASDIADWLQCRMDGSGDHLYAATLLGQFVPEHVPWVHLDLTSAHQAESSPMYTGNGPRWAIQFLESIQRISSMKSTLSKGQGNLFK